MQQEDARLAYNILAILSLIGVFGFFHLIGSMGDRNKPKFYKIKKRN